jgi:hypothetical protein
MDVAWGPSTSIDTSTSPRLALPLDNVIRRVCSLLDRMVGKGKSVEQLQELAKIKAEHTAATGAHAAAASTRPAATKADCLDKHKRVSYAMLTSCLSTVSGVDVPTITAADLATAKLKLLSEQGGGALLDKPAAAFKDAVLPDAIRLKAQQVYKSKVISSLLQAFIVTATDSTLSSEALAVIRGLILNIVRITTPPQQAAGSTELPAGFCNLNEPPSAVTDGLVFATDCSGGSSASGNTSAAQAAAAVASSSTASSTSSARSRSMSTSQDDRQMLYDQEVSKHSSYCIEAMHHTAALLAQQHILMQCCTAVPVCISGLDLNVIPCCTVKLVLARVGC